MEITKEMVRQRIEKIPEELRNFVLSDRKIALLHSVGYRHGLSSAELAKLNKAATCFFINLIPKDGLGSYIKDFMPTTEEKAAQLAEEVTEIAGKIPEYSMLPDISDNDKDWEGIFNEPPLDVSKPDSAHESLAFLDEKLTGIVKNAPSGEASINTAKSQQTPPNPPPAAPQQPTSDLNHYSGKDPYREPLE